MANENRQANHDHDVRCVEYSRMKRANADDDKAGDKTVSGNPVNEVARPARPNQRETHKIAAAKAGAHSLFPVRPGGENNKGQIRPAILPRAHFARQKRELNLPCPHCGFQCGHGKFENPGCAIC